MSSNDHDEAAELVADTAAHRTVKAGDDGARITLEELRSDLAAADAAGEGAPTEGETPEVVRTSPTQMLTRLQEAVAAGIAAQGGDPNVSLAEELLADRAADAALEADRYADRYAAPDGPLALCRRYVDGDLAREELVQQLAEYPYVTIDRDPDDDFSPDPPGGWWEVQHAERRGLIDMDLYATVYHRRHPSVEAL